MRASTNQGFMNIKYYLCIAAFSMACLTIKSDDDGPRPEQLKARIAELKEKAKQTRDNGDEEGAQKLMRQAMELSQKGENSRPEKNQGKGGPRDFNPDG